MLRGSSRKRKDTIVKNLTTTLQGKSGAYPISIEDTFKAPSSSWYAQLRKSRGTPLEVVDSLKTALVANALLLIEILPTAISVAIVAKRSVLMEIKYLEHYTYEALHQAHERITQETIPYVADTYRSLEMILNIIAYEAIYRLPHRMVVIDDTITQFYGISKAPTASPSDGSPISSKEFQILSGYPPHEVYETRTLYPNPSKANAPHEDRVYLFSIAQKEAVDSLSRGVGVLGYEIKKLHALYSALYSTLANRSQGTQMRIHVVERTAYCLQRHTNGAFETHEYDLSYEYEGLELVTYRMDEVIVSGGGVAYEQLKQNLQTAQVNLRTFNYIDDLPKAIIRLEKGLVLDNSFALLIGVGYYELFGVNFKTLRLGVTLLPTGYERLRDNLHLLPFALLLLVILGAYGADRWVEYRYEQIHEENKELSRLLRQKEKLQEAIKRREKDIQRILSRTKRLDDLLASRLESEDALILHEIAQKIPDDIILTHISKKLKGAKGSVIHITGKCFQERSLLEYIKALKFRDKKVFLTSLVDSRKVASQRVNSKSSASIYANFLENFVPKEGRAKESKEVKEMIRQMEIMASQKQEVYFADTINNTFVLEIK